MTHKQVPGHLEASHWQVSQMVANQTEESRLEAIQMAVSQMVAS